MPFSSNDFIKIGLILPNDTFHKFFYIESIQSRTKVLTLLNLTEINDNFMIERGKEYGILIVKSERDNNYYLFYNDDLHKDLSFQIHYIRLTNFKKKIDDNDNYGSVNVISNFTHPLVKSVISLIKNTEPIRYKCINLLEFPNDYVIKYSHDMRLAERITRNPFFNEISIDKTSYYNFIVDKKGIVIGEVFDSLENGVVHHLLVDNPDDEVYIAGEIKIYDNKLEYNFYSGSYSAPQKTSKKPILSYYLEILVNKIFKLQRFGTTSLTSITLVHTFLLPRKPFDRPEFNFFCSRFRNKIVKVPDGNRCINNTYSNLTAPIKAQIETNFTTNSNLLCNEPIDNLFPSVPPVIDLVKENNIFDTIENELKKFGLDIKLGTLEELKKEFIKIIMNPLKLATFKDVVVDSDGSSSIEFNRVRSDGSIERKIFTYKKHLSSGSFNKTDIYEDRTTSNFKEYIFRSSKIGTTISQQFFSFYENLKHIVLYIIIRKRLGNIKFIPQPYHFGLKRGATGNITLYMIMEKGKSTLDDYIETSTLSTLDIKKLVFSIYYNLYELSNLCIHDKDTTTLLKFKHGDFKCNNLVVSEKGAPLIIDFGFSRFTIFSRVSPTDSGKSIDFESCESPGVYYPTLNGYNVIHDMLQLIASFNFIKKSGFKPFTILKFINNKNSNILDTDVITTIINSNYGYNAINLLHLFSFFYTDFNLIKNTSKKYTIEITPSELAYNIDLTLADRITDEFEKKYKKYKMKYLNLVSQL